MSNTMFCNLLLVVACVTWLTVSADEIYTAATLKKIAEFDKLIDDTVNPCDDFQKYVCSRKKVNFLKECGELVSILMMMRVNAGKQPTDQEAVTKFYDFIEKCKAGFDKYDATLQRLLEDLDNVLKDDGGNYRPFDATLIAELTAYLYVHHLTYIFITPDYLKRITKYSRFSTKNRLIYFDEFGLSQNRVLYDPNVLPYKKDLLNALFQKGVATAFPAKSAYEVNETAEKFLQFEKEMAKLQQFPKEKMLAKNLQELTVSEAMTIYPEVDWKAYVISLSSYLGIDLLKGSKLEDYPLGFITPDLVKALPKVIKMVSEDTLREYIKFRVISKYYSLIQKDSADIGCQLFAVQSFSLVSQHFIITGMLPTPEDRLEWKKSMSKVVDDVIVSATNMLERNSWIKNDGKTYAGFKDKINKLTKVVGFRDELANQTWLDEQHKDFILDDADNLYSLYLKSMKFLVKSFYVGDANATMKLPGAQLDPSTNEIQINIGLVMDDIVFHPDYLPALNYGSLGTIIGHEILHDFDNEGSEYDGDGYFNPWMGDKSKAKFDSMAQCVIDEYNKFNVTDSHGVTRPVNGTLTVGENLSDIGGIRAAYMAFKNNPDHTQSFPKTKKLEKYTQEQLFFLAFAQNYCSAPFADFSRLFYDVHSPDEIRILGTLQNFVPFREAFNCPANSVYAPAKHCEVYTPDLDSGVSALLPSLILLVIIVLVH